jgi:hypothetical protein
MEDNADAVHAVLSELRLRKPFCRAFYGRMYALAFAELYLTR